MGFSQGVNLLILGSYWRIKDDKDLAHTVGEVAVEVKDLIQM